MWPAKKHGAILPSSTHTGRSRQLTLTSEQVSGVDGEPDEASEILWGDGVAG